MGLRAFLGLGQKRRALRSSELQALQSELQQRFSAKDCFVVGSAPAVRYAPHSKCICVNGSGWSAKRMGIDTPDLTLISGWSLRGNNPVRVATADVLSGLRTKTVLLVDIGLSTSEARKALSALGYKFEDILTTTTAERAAIFADVCGKPVPKGDFDARPSNGLFAVALALWGGASDITMSGFSLSGGHSYMTGNTPREHVQGDKWFLSQTKNLPITII